MENSSKKSVAKAKETVKEIVDNKVVVNETNVKSVLSETISEISEAVNFADSVAQVKESAKVINTQLKDSANEIINDVKEVTTGVQNATSKGLKELSDNLAIKENVKESVEKVKATAKKVEDKVVENAQELKKTSVKLANEVVENLKISDRLNSLKTAVVNANDYALNTSNELIEGIEANGLKWQGVTKKAIKTGLKLADSQNELVFGTLEAVKTQVVSTTTRFKKLFVK